MPDRSTNVIWKGLLVISLKTASHRVWILLVFCVTALLRSIVACLASLAVWTACRAISMASLAMACAARAMAL